MGKVKVRKLSRSAPTVAEIVQGRTPKRLRRAAPLCQVLIEGKERRGTLDPYAGTHQLTVPAYTSYVARLLRQIFVGRRQVIAEWRAMLGETRRHFRTGRQVVYSPEVDLAVGPFAILQSCEEEYDRLAELHAQLLEAMLRAFQRNLRHFGSCFRSPSLGGLCSHNLNARCFMAVEIEKGNRDVKYLMGSMLNAASLGRVGVVVAWDLARLGDLIRPRETLAMWGAAGKNTLNTGNVLFLTRRQMVQALLPFAEAIVASPPYRARSRRPPSCHR